MINISRRSYDHLVILIGSLCPFGKNSYLSNIFYFESLPKFHLTQFLDETASLVLKMSVSK